MLQRVTAYLSASYCGVAMPMSGESPQSDASDAVLTALNYLRCVITRWAFTHKLPNVQHHLLFGAAADLLAPSYAEGMAVTFESKSRSAYSGKGTTLFSVSNRKTNPI